MRHCANALQTLILTNILRQVSPFKETEAERSSITSSNLYSKKANVLRFKLGSFSESKLVATAFYYCHRVSSSNILKFCDLVVPEKTGGGVEVNLGDLGQFWILLCRVRMNLRVLRTRLCHSFSQQVLSPFCTAVSPIMWNHKEELTSIFLLRACGLEMDMKSGT